MTRTPQPRPSSTLAPSALAPSNLAPRRFRWDELSTADFAGLDPERTIAVIPVAAIEQHGPHLPVGVDTMIADGMIGEVLLRLPTELSILVLPTQSIGKSNEHVRSPGTLTLNAPTAIQAWTEIGEAVHRAGLRKIVFVNSHGGNVDVLSIVARDLRVRLGMLVVSSAWRRLGLPAGLYSDLEASVGIHAGDIETSLMLHFRPELVVMANALNFAPTTIEISTQFDILRPTGFNAFGWIAQDLHPSGAAGDATQATAEKGRLTAVHQALEFIKLLGDVTRFGLHRLA
jgi:creatinine amidohydrolase